MTKENSNNKKLGRGLFELLGEKDVINNSKLDNQNLIQEIEISKIVTGTYQPRSNFKNHDLEELARSIKENGLIQPIIVRKIGDDGKYEIVAGERRFRASKMIGLRKIATLVKNISDDEALEFAIIENVQRADLLPIEEAQGYKRLINEFSYTQEQLSNKIGKSRSHIANILRLLLLPKEVQEMLNDGKISMGHARAIINQDDPVKIAQKIVKESLSVRDVEEIITLENHKNQIKSKKNSENSDLKSRQIKNQRLRKIENDLSKILKIKVKATYDSRKKSGKLILFCQDLNELEKLANKFSKI